MSFLSCVRQLCGRRVWVFGLGALGCLLAFVQWSLAQTFPGQQDPVGGPNSVTGGSPNRLILFPDDELAIISFAPVDDGSGRVPLWIQELSPNADYTVPTQPPNTSNAPQPSPAPQSEENIFSNAGMARGRFVDPNRDALVALTKVQIGPALYDGCTLDNTDIVNTSCMSWVLQEITFTMPPPTLNQKTLPTFKFSAPVAPFNNTILPFSSTGSPGAITAGDFDKAIDKDGNYHDEIAMVTEYYDIRSGFAEVGLSVIDYAITPGHATANATIIGLPGGPMAYPLNISTLRPWHGQQGQAGRPRYPGMLAVTTGDFDGDGTTDIGVVALTYDPSSQDNLLQVYFYKYHPGYTQTPPQAGSLTLMGSQFIAGGPDDPTNLVVPFFHGPLSATSGDVDDDGKDDVIVAFLDHASTGATGTFGDLTFHADLLLATVAFDPTTKAVTVTQAVAAHSVEAWYDRMNDDTSSHSNPPQRYQDIRVAAGLFKFNPELGYPLTRRQIALAYVNGSHVEVTLWELQKPGEGGNTGQTDVLVPYSTTNGKISSLPIPFCAGNGGTNSISLVAGNFAGVKAKQPNTPPVWGLAVAYEVNATQVGATVLRVDQGVDWAKSLFPITPMPPLTVPHYDNVCSRSSRNVLAAFDFDGDSLRLGAPVHFVLNDVQHFDYVLQEPPKHVDYLPDAATCNSQFAYTCNGIINVSELPDFNITYGTSATNTVSHSTTKNTSWGLGVSTTFTAQNTVGENGGIEKVEGTLDFKAQVGYDYDQHQDSYKGNDSSYKVSQESVTSADDALSFQTRTTDIWRYRIYGAPSQTDPNGQPLNSFYEIALPRALCTSHTNVDPPNCTGQSVVGGGKAHLELYQPWHENGNILSYPAADTAFQPTDIGPWTRARCDTCKDQCTSTIKTNCCAPNKDDPTKEDCTIPLAPTKQFSWDGTEQKEAIELDTSLTTGSTTQWTSKFSADLNIGIGWEFSENAIFEDTGTGCVDVDLHGYGSWGDLSTATTTTTMTTDIALNKPAGDVDNLYNFFPTLYVDTRGAFRAVHSVTIPSDASFWSTHYQHVDPALNLPKKFSDVTSIGTSNGFKQFNTESDAKEMRGFLLRNGNTSSPAYGTLLSCGPVQKDDPALHNQVLLEARIYNYSVVSSVSNVPVRFDVVELTSDGEECSDPKACLTRRPLGTVTATCTNPNNAAATSCTTSGPTTLHPRGMGLAQYTLDISTLPLPTVGPSNPFRFYVVIDPDNAIPGETHEWHQATVVLTPDTSFGLDGNGCVDIQDAQGSLIEHICIPANPRRWEPR